MPPADTIDAILSDLADYTSAMVAIPAPTYPAALAINSAVANATQLSRDLLHLKMVTTLADLQAATAALKVETTALEAQTKAIEAAVGKIANATKAASIILKVAVAVASI